MWKIRAVPGSWWALTPSLLVSSLPMQIGDCHFPHPSPHPPSSFLSLPRFPLKSLGHKYWRGPKGFIATLSQGYLLAPWLHHGCPGANLSIRLFYKQTLLHPPNPGSDGPSHGGLRRASWDSRACCPAAPPSSSHHSCPKVCRDHYCPSQLSKEDTCCPLFLWEGSQGVWGKLLQLQ